VTANEPNPQNKLTFSLGAGAPAGVVVNPSSGQITWVTSPTFAGTTNLISVIATDNGQPPLSATGTVAVVVQQNINPPTLAPIPNYSIYEAQLLTVTNSATDNNLPPKPLTFSLGQGAPTNATINPVTGVFQWRPTADQASGSSGTGTNLISWDSTTNLISVIVMDNSAPPLSATQQFTVVVTAVSYEYALSLGTTNLLVGETSSVPVTLNTTLPLTNITTFVQAPSALLTNLTLLSVSPEILSTILQPLGTNQYVVSLALNPALSPGISRTLAQLGFKAVLQTNSAIVPLGLSQLSAVQTDGQFAPKPGAFGGRVYIIGSQPLLDAWLGTNADRMLTIYGNPGASYQIAYNTNLLGTNWLTAWRVPMTNQYAVFSADQKSPLIFYRARDFSANPPILELGSSGPTNIELLVYGQKGSNYMVMVGTNLSHTSEWTPMAGFTMTNSFQFINTGGTTNPVMFFRAEQP
jgi:hypothetical protein